MFFFGENIKIRYEKLDLEKLILYNYNNFSR